MPKKEVIPEKRGCLYVVAYALVSWLTLGYVAYQYFAT